jgi:hypothetical protein
LITAIGTDIKNHEGRIATLELGGGGGTDPWTYKVVAADVSNSTVTAAEITNLTMPTGLAAGKYILEGKIFFTAGAATTGMQLGLLFGTSWEVAALWQVPSGATAVTVLNQTASAVYSGNTASPAAAPLDSVALLDAMINLPAASTGPLSVQQRSEVAASAVVAKAGSFIRYRKIA